MNTPTTDKSGKDQASRCDRHISATLYPEDEVMLKELKSHFGGNTSEMFRLWIRGFHGGGPELINDFKSRIATK